MTPERGDATQLVQRRVVRIDEANVLADLYASGRRLAHRGMGMSPDWPHWTVRAEPFPLLIVQLPVELFQTARSALWHEAGDVSRSQLELAVAS